jgi:D-arabinose 1-dehydrogenase-like Zn-dependent alcohol dehydrogenase
VKALCWYGKFDVRVDKVPDPKALNPRDAVVKVTSTAICGSDLHEIGAETVVACHLQKVARERHAVPVSASKMSGTEVRS